MPPINDDIANATDLGTDPTFPINVSGTNITATWDADEAANFYAQPSVWYKFTLTSTTLLNISITKTGSDPDWEPYAELYEDVVVGTPDFNDLVAEYREYVGDTSHTPTVGTLIASFPAGTYYMSVTNWNFDGSTDDFDIEVAEQAAPPSNDDWNGRTELPEKYTVCVQGTTDGATFNAFGSEPNVNPSGDNVQIPTVWYEWLGPNYNNSPLNVEFEVIGAPGDYYIEIITGNPFGQTVTDSVKNTSLTKTTTGSTVYRIRVSTPVGDVGDFEFRATIDPGGSPPANDDWANAEVLTGSVDSTSGTTEGATGECAEQFDEEYMSESTNTVWYKWTPPQTGRVIVWLETPSDDIQMYVWRGSSLANLVIIKDVSMFVGGFEDYMTFTAEGGHDYYFQVMGDGGNETTFDLSFEQTTASAPANDDPANATLITTDGTITQTTEGANWDSVGPYTGHFVDEAWEEITTWYKFVASADGNFVVTFNDDVHHSTLSASERTFLGVWKGSDLSTAVNLIQIAEPDHPSIPFTGEAAIEAGETYWISLQSGAWSDSLDVDYEFNYETDNGSFEPTPDTGSTAEFDSVTGFFVADDIDGEFVASGSVGYGTIEPWNDGHYPYGWWTRFYLRSSTGDYLYRYGQTQQFIEVFRATKENADYHSLVVIGHRNGVQTLGVAVNGSVVADTDYKVWGANGQGTTGRVRIELGRNGVTIDGRNLILETYFQDDYTNQFVEFDYGIRSYPSDGTATVDLDPEWDMRYSGIVLHDDPERNVVGQLDPNLPEVTSIAGFTYGTLLADSDSFNIISGSNLPAIVASAGDYDGFSLDCSETGTVNLNPCGVHWLTASNPFLTSVRDSFFPGFSFRFWVHTFPTADLIIASITRAAGAGAENGSYLILGDEGTLYIKPSYDSDPIPFCSVTEDSWNYIELQADTHERVYATKIWLQDTYMGRFESTVTSADTTRIPNSPPHWSSFSMGRLGDPLSMFSGQFNDTPVEIEFRDVAITRHKHDRPIGPSIVIPMSLEETGTHQIEDPDDVTITADQISFNEDFSGGTDGAGQPQYWTGYDRGDDVLSGHPRPAGAMYLAYLFGSVFYDSFVSLVSDGTGPPGHTGESAIKIETAEDGGPAAAAYVFGGATEPAIDLKYDIAYSDTIGVEMWVKGVAGHTVRIRSASGIGGWPDFNTHTMNGSWEKIRLFTVPVATNDALYAIIVEFPDAGVGDSYLIKQFHAYVNMDAQPGLFFETADGGTTTTVIPPGDTTSHEKIDEFPPSGSDQIYLSTSSFRNTLRGDEDDNHTYVAPAWSDDYLEYIMEEYNPDDGQKVLGAKLLLGLSGYNGINPQISPWEDAANFTDMDSGITHIVISNGENRRYTGEFAGEGVLFGVSMPLPPAQGEWTINKWNEFLLRFGYHDTVFQNSQLIIADFSDGGVVQGVAGELLTYDRRLAPPACVRPIDLSRIRFRAWEANELDD